MNFEDETRGECGLSRQSAVPAATPEASGAGEAPPEASPGPAAPDAGESPERLRQELEELRGRDAQSRNALLRARAEIENLRKRQQRELDHASRYALEDFLRDLLPVLDSLELGCRNADDDPVVAGDETLREGLLLTLQLLRDHLGKAGVQAIDPVEDETFDPELHEAVSTSGDAPGGGTLQVASVLQKGYRLHDRLLRPARVVVVAK